MILHASSLVLTANHQYPAIEGIEDLRSAVARRYRPAGRELNAENVAITAGATEALAACLMASIEPGDEVIFFEPGFVSFAPLIERLGGVAIPIEVAFPSGEIDLALLERNFSSRTKALVYVNPANPSGTCHNQRTTDQIARICEAKGVTLISDEVWEDVILDGKSHVSALDSTANRKILKIGAIGKSFAVTGWKVAWVIGSPKLIRRVVEAHSLLTFAVNPIMQSASAWALDNRARLFEPMRSALSAARNTFADALHRAGMKPIVGPATYFLMLDLHAEGLKIDATEACKQLASQSKIRALPLSTFRTTLGPNRHVRLCFAKSDELLLEAADRLAQFIDSNRATTRC